MRASRPRTHSAPPTVTRAGRPRTRHARALTARRRRSRGRDARAPTARPRPRHARAPMARRRRSRGRDARALTARRRRSRGRDACAPGRPRPWDARAPGTPAPPAYTWLNHSAFRYKVAVVFAFDVLQSPIFHMPQRPGDPLTGGDQHQRRHQRKQESQSVGKQQEERIEHYRFGAFDQPRRHRHRRGFAP